MVCVVKPAKTRDIKPIKFSAYQTGIQDQKLCRGSKKKPIFDANFDSQSVLVQIKNVVRHIARFHAYQLSGRGDHLLDLRGKSPVDEGFERFFAAFSKELVAFEPGVS